MPVDAIDAQIQSLISGAQLETQKEIGKEDEADHARKVAEKKIALKKENLKSSNLNREVFNRQNDIDNKMRQILGGAAGREAAGALNEWQNNPRLQSRLTEAQKNLFREAMAQNPQKGAQTARTLNHLSAQPGFDKAVSNSQQMGTLQEGMLKNPKAEKPVAELLQSRFMQASKSDSQAKNQFLRFGMQQVSKGQMDSLRKAGDMLGTMSRSNVGRTAQRAAMNMAQRGPANSKAMSNVDSFVQNPNVAKLPSFARTKATELLAKADGKTEVKEGFEKLAGDGKFRSQTAHNKGRFFATVGSGRPSEYRAITDKALLALHNPAFPKRAAQVGKLLGKMSGAIQKGGAQAIDPDALIKSSKMSALPSAPRLASTQGLDEDEARRVRAQNRAKVIQFFNKLQRTYDEGEKKLNSAKYLEDVNALKNLREGEDIDVSMLSVEDREFVEGRKGAMRERLDKLRTLQRQRSRELRTKRMPPAKRRARAAARRAQGRQPKYFSPNLGRRTGSEAFLKKAVGDPRPAPLPSTPARGQMRAAPAGDVQDQVAAAMVQLGDGPMTPQKAGQVAKIIAQQVAQQVAAQVTEQLLGGAAAGDSATAPPPSASQQSGRSQQGKVDGWGIPRTFERDLGGTQRAAVHPKEELDPAPTYEELEAEAYRGRMIVKDPSAIREAAELFALTWKKLSKAEMALLRNLGWTQQAWDTKDGPAAKWPMAMATLFAKLNPTQRESVRKLGFSPQDWDKRVQAFSMGKNA
jgi:hypothetical protein